VWQRKMHFSLMYSPRAVPGRSSLVLDGELVREALAEVVVFEVAVFTKHSHFERYLLRSINV